MDRKQNKMMPETLSEIFKEKLLKLRDIIADQISKTFGLLVQLEIKCNVII